MTDALIVSAVRTPVGKAPNGSLRSTRPDELAATVMREVMHRAPGVAASEIEDVILGCAMPEAEQGLNVARIASLRAGLPVEASAVTINRFCASGLQAIAFAADRIKGGSAGAIIAGGTESMSLVPMGGNKVAPNPSLVDTYPDVYLTTGLVAENHARDYAISREAQDAFALRSHQRALAALDAGKFRDETIAIGDFVSDEGPRRDTSLDALSKLRPAFHVKGTVTAGNSSQTSDGAAAVLVTSDAFARERGLKPLARFVAYATAGVAPERFGTGPVPAIQKGAEAGGPVDERHRPHRAERSLRFAGAGVPARAADGRDAPERQRRRDCARPPVGMHGRETDDDIDLRDAPAAGALWPRDDVRRRRHGRSRYSGAHRMTTTLRK